MLKMYTASIAAVIVSATSASALSLGLNMSSGEYDEPLTAEADGVTATFTNDTPGQSDLNVAAGLSKLTSSGICAGTGSLLGLISPCNEKLKVDFSDPVNNLGFDITGVSVLQNFDFAAMLSDGTTVTANDSNLISLSLLGGSIGGARVKTDLQGVSSFTFQSASILDLNGPYIGDIRFDVGGVEGPGDGDMSPVPVPAAVWLLGIALGGLGVVKRRG